VLTSLQLCRIDPFEVDFHNEGLWGRDQEMAVCERGYLCAVCGEDVEEITDSVLYLRYVLGEIAWENLDRSPEKHIRCDPILAQFIVSDCFAPVTVDGVFSKSGLDPEFVKEEETRVTAGFLRLRAVAGSTLPIAEYPLSRTRMEVAQESSAAEP
jgi:hypothetical protein